MNLISANTARYQHGAYPIFSLQTKLTKLIAEVEQLLKSNNIPYEKIKLPGVMAPEIGFAIPIEHMQVFDELPKSEELYDHFGAWSCTPTITPLPNPEIIPSYCLQTVEKAFLLSAPDEPKSIIILNTITGEKATLFRHEDPELRKVLPEAAKDWTLFTVIGGKRGDTLLK